MIGILTDAFKDVVRTSLNASIVACGVVLVRFLLMKAPKIFSYMLWAAVLFRLAIPVSLGKLPWVPASTNPLIDIVDFFAPGKYTGKLHVYFTLIWLAGIVGLIGYALISYIPLKNRLSTATLVRTNMYETVYETDRISTPFVFGFFKPVIYMPIGMSELDFILEHEQTHIHRRDHLVKLVAFLALCLHWFNPVMWISYFLMVKDMEMSCDENVLRHSDRENIRKEYSASLLALSVRQSGLFVPLAFGESNTKARIQKVLRYKKPVLFVNIAASIILISIILAFTATSEKDMTVQDIPPGDDGVILSGEAYVIRNVNSRQPFWFDSNNDVVQDAKNVENTQQWLVTSDGEGCYYISISDKYLQPEQKYKHGSQMKVGEKCDAAKFILRRICDDQFLIIPKLTSENCYVLDVCQQSILDGMHIIQYSYLAGNNQKWYFELVS